MIHLLIFFGQTGFFVFFILWGLRNDVAFTARGRKKIRFIYLLPVIAYILLTTVFARHILSFVGSAAVPIMYGPIGNTLVLFVFPVVNVFFLLTCFVHICVMLTQWEWIVKFNDRYLPCLPLMLFLSLLATAVLFSTRPLSWETLKPLAVWLAFMLTTYGLVTFIVLYDLKRQFKKELAEKTAAIEAGRASGKKKLLLIYPINDTSLGYTAHMYLRFPPLSLGILAALTPRDKFHVEMIDEQFERFVYREADLVAITAFTVYAPRAYEIAAVYREKGIPVIMGGIHASMATEEAQQYVDCIVKGEAENLWPGVLEDFLSGNLKPIYEGSYPELKNMVHPDRTVFHHLYVSNAIQTSRGCPHNCDFCSVTQFNGGRYRQRPVDDILDELETFPNRYFFFADDNLIGYGKAAEERALALFKGMVKRKIKKRWITQTTIDIGAKPELLKWAAKSGCAVLFIGLEFIDHENLKSVKKNFALKVDYKQALKNINRAGIGVLGAFLYGNDIDTEEKLLARADFVANDRVDLMHQMILTPIPGSQLYATMEKENRIVCNNYPDDWEYYNGFSLIQIPRNMSRKEFLRIYRQCMEKTYAYHTLWLKAMRTLIHTRHAEVAIAALRSNFGFKSFTFSNLEKQEQKIFQEE
ncbi:MAG: radical SAM protein [Thermodesulfobacteriota bacterium]|nr:radical SAM protein [Thermodesulfobacteriota bacterium]